MEGKYLRPMQILGPLPYQKFSPWFDWNVVVCRLGAWGEAYPLKGRYCHPGCIIAHLSGRNSSASLPYRSFRLCMTETWYWTTAFLGMKRGDCPSWPPPLGRTVSVIAILALNGTTGCSRRAGWWRERLVCVKLSRLNRSRWRHTFIEKGSQILHLFQIFKSRAVWANLIHFGAELGPDIWPLGKDKPSITQ